MNGLGGDAELTDQPISKFAGGGCSGFQYDIRLDGQNPDDLVIEGKGQKVFVDAASLPFYRTL